MRAPLLSLSLLVALALGAAAAARADDVPGFLVRHAADPYQVARGPIEVRDEYMPAQVRLTLPATTPDPLGCGCWRATFQVDWGNDFTFNQEGPAESPFADRHFIVDGEHRTFALSVERGVRPDLDVGVRVPIHWRGGGMLDSIIDWWHRWTGTADNARPFFDRDRYRVEGSSSSGRSFDWDGERGIGLGNVEAWVRYAFRRPARRSDWRAALVGRLSVPTGTGPFETGSVDLGAQVVAAKQLRRRWDVYMGLGGTWFSKEEIRGWRYEHVRAAAFLAAEWRFLPTMSLLVQSDAASRLVTDVRDHPGLEWYAEVGVKWDVCRPARVFVGFTENIIDQESTLDVGFWAGIETRF